MPASKMSSISISAKNKASNAPIAVMRNPSKEFPALMVMPKAAKSTPALAFQRTELDNKVKSLLVLTPAKFTEWLIQQQLVLSEQVEIIAKKKWKLKLVMHSDTKRFAQSGGYVWVNEKPVKFVSVYRGSLFEVSNQPPIVVLKLLYHWACQTSINNIIQWVKVDNLTINQFWEMLRSVCVATVQEELGNLGGKGKAVEIGVILLGTTSSDGTNREVRVEVLGVLDRASGTVRLRATEPIRGASQDVRFAKIFEPLCGWIDSSSQIISDMSIDQQELKKLGFTNLLQCIPQEKTPSKTNLQVMEYLKRIVPRMFQNNLSLLKTNLVQQFLDELTFRESFGHFPQLCFDNIVKRMAIQTSIAASTNRYLSQRLRAISQNPFQNWKTSSVKIIREDKTPKVNTTAVSRHVKRSLPKAQLPEVTLYMECKDEPLSSAQRSMHLQQFEEMKEHIFELNKMVTGHQL